MHDNRCCRKCVCVYIYIYVCIYIYIYIYIDTYMRIAVVSYLVGIPGPVSKIEVSLEECFENGRQGGIQKKVPEIIPRSGAENRRFAPGVSKSRPDSVDTRRGRKSDCRACRRNLASISALPARISGFRCPVCTHHQTARGVR